MNSTTLALPDTQHAADQINRWTREYAAFALLIEQADSASSALQQFAAISRMHGQNDIAIEALLAALVLMPTDIVAWRELASDYQLSGRDELAEACARRALAIDPDHATTWLQYASLAYRLQRIDDAEAAYLRALSGDATLGDAHLGLGVLYLGSRRPEHAITHLQHALSWGGIEGVTHLCLGQAFYMAGRFGESADALAMANRFVPLEGVTLRLYARARTFASMLEGDIQGAIVRYPTLAGPETEPLDEVLRTAFALFSAYGMHEAAATVGRMRLESQPDDPVQRYLLDAVGGQTHDRAPASYVEAHFDEFAEGFDSKLVDVLGYKVPQQLADMIASCQPTLATILDLGCGTGLAAEPLGRFGARLTGIDLSEKMLAVAARRNAYHDLIKADVMSYLADSPRSFDLVFAADLLIYLGRLDELIGLIAQVLPAGGLFAASIERAGHGDFTLLSSGRFAHSETYFEACAAKPFEIVRKENSELRLEAGRPALGTLYVLRRRDRPNTESDQLTTTTSSASRQRRTNDLFTAPRS
ncbi:methyltransferase domain-containing protein [Tardiphaga sp.]|uniref:methyltransferase domain-containing protein n=1 Tax=Tardiphaga sp. TaxID=1926292 RepID=UPI00352A029A